MNFVKYKKDKDMQKQNINFEKLKTIQQIREIKSNLINCKNQHNNMINKIYHLVRKSKFTDIYLGDYIDDILDKCLYSHCDPVEKKYMSEFLKINGLISNYVNIKKELFNTDKEYYENKLMDLFNSEEARENKNLKDVFEDILFNFSKLNSIKEEFSDDSDKLKSPFYKAKKYGAENLKLKIKLSLLKDSNLRLQKILEKEKKKNKDLENNKLDNSIININNKQKIRINILNTKLKLNLKNINSSNNKEKEYSSFNSFSSIDSSNRKKDCKIKKYVLKKSRSNFYTTELKSPIFQTYYTNNGFKKSLSHSKSKIFDKNNENLNEKIFLNQAINYMKALIEKENKNIRELNEMKTDVIKSNSGIKYFLSKSIQDLRYDIDELNYKIKKNKNHDYKGELKENEKRLLISTYIYDNCLNGNNKVKTLFQNQKK